MKKLFQTLWILYQGYQNIPPVLITISMPILVGIWAFVRHQPDVIIFILAFDVLTMCILLWVLYDRFIQAINRTNTNVEKLKAFLKRKMKQGHKLLNRIEKSDLPRLAKLEKESKFKQGVDELAQIKNCYFAWLESINEVMKVAMKSGITYGDFREISTNDVVGLRFRQTLPEDIQKLQKVINALKTAHLNERFNADILIEYEDFNCS
jgi:hypothetical protein